MTFINTTPSQDNEIIDAQASRDIQNLIAIIESLDQKISEWKSAAGEWDCDTPEELRDRINGLPAIY